MAKGALVFTWGSDVRGRETKATEVLGEVLTYCDGLTEQGRVEGVRTYFAYTGDLPGGLMIIEGELSQLQAIQLEQEYQRVTFMAENVVEHLRIQVMAGGTPEDLQEPVTLYTEVLDALGLA